MNEDSSHPGKLPGHNVLNLNGLERGSIRSSPSQLSPSSQGYQGPYDFDPIVSYFDPTQVQNGPIQVIHWLAVRSNAA